MAEQLTFDFAPPPVRLAGTLVLTGTAGRLEVSVQKRPPDPPPPGMEEAVWVEFFYELADILRNAWMALREMLLSARRHA